MKTGASIKKKELKYVALASEPHSGRTDITCFVTILAASTL